MVDAQIIRMPRRLGALQYRNFHPNPKLATTADDWAGLPAGATTSVSARRSTTSPFIPSAYVYRMQYSSVPTATPTSILATGIPVTPGNTVSAAIAMRTISAAAAVTSARCDIQFLNAAGTQIASVLGTPAPLEGQEWAVRRNTTVLVPELAVTARVGAVLSSPAVWAVSGTSFDATCAILVNGNSVPDYFDGDVENTLTHQYSWVGAANASASNRIFYNSADITTPLLTLADSMALRIPTNNTVHQVIGASLPIVTQQPLGGRTGDLQFLFANAGEADAFVTNLRGGTYFDLLYPDEPTLQFRFTLAEGDVESALDAESQTAWVVTVPVVEVAL